MAWRDPPCCRRWQSQPCKCGLLLETLLIAILKLTISSSVKVRKGEVLAQLEAEEDPVVSFTVENASSEEPLAATSHKSGLVRLWTWALVEEGKKELKTEVSNGYYSYRARKVYKTNI